MAYGARLESVLGASPRGFESPILRHRTPGPLQVPGFLLPVAPLVFRAPEGPAAVCAGGRRPAREPSALRVVACGAAGVLGAVGPGRPRDRHTRASLGVVDLEARPCPPGPPAPSTPAALVSLGLARPGPAATHRHRGRSLQTSGALHTGGTCDAVRIGRQSGGPELLSPGLVLLRLRGLRRSLHPGARPGPRPLRTASIGAGPSRCSSIRPSTPSR